jgi:hypothetical protein
MKRILLGLTVSICSLRQSRDSAALKSSGLALATDCGDAQSDGFGIGH